MRNWNDIPEPSMEPPEPKVIDHCAYCGDEIYSGNPVYICDDGRVHAECVLQYIAMAHHNDSKICREIATSCGYREEIA